MEMCFFCIKKVILPLKLLETLILLKLSCLMLEINEFRC